jgi:hypothetical protein
MDDVEHRTLIGAWELQGMVSVGSDGGVGHPLGEHPSGVILYTPDGGVSATISAEPSSGAVDVSYAGWVSIDGNAITHHVLVGADPYRAGELLVRDAELTTDGMLQLTARGPELLQMTWKRLRRS